MSKRPKLHVIEGLRAHGRGIYRLRDDREQHAAVEKPWPNPGEWRDLVRRLVRNPLKAEETQPFVNAPRRRTP